MGLGKRKKEVTYSSKSIEEKKWMMERNFKCGNQEK